VTKHRPITSIALGVALLTSIAVQTMLASAVSTTSKGNVSFRAVLCYAPLLSTKTAFSPAAALATCTSKYQLTAKNLDVQPSNSPAGFTVKTVKPDPRFLNFRVTPSAKILAQSDILVPGINGDKTRYVLGPTEMTTSSIKSAKAVKGNLGEWVVDYRLTKKGSLVWDAFAKKQFHAFIAVVANGEVYSAPLIEPSANRFTSFKDSGQISGSFTRTDALDLAAWMSPKK
jgi:hypothetical protein